MNWLWSSRCLSQQKLYTGRLTLIVLCREKFDVKITWSKVSIGLVSGQFLYELFGGEWNAFFGMSSIHEICNKEICGKDRQPLEIVQDTCSG